MHTHKRLLVHTERPWDCWMPWALHAHREGQGQLGFSAPSHRLLGPFSSGLRQWPFSAAKHICLRSPGQSSRSNTALKRFGKEVSEPLSLGETFKSNGGGGQLRTISPRARGRKQTNKPKIKNKQASQQTKAHIWQNFLSSERKTLNYRDREQ